MTTHTIRPELVTQSYPGSPSRKVLARLIVRGARNYGGFGICYVPPGESARQEQDGPMVPGPWAATFGLATVIDCDGGTAGEIKSERAAGRIIEANVGDAIRLDGNDYRIEWKPSLGQITREYVALVRA